MLAGVRQAIRTQRAALALGLVALALLAIVAVASGVHAAGGGPQSATVVTAVRPAGQAMVAIFSALLIISVALAAVIVYFLLPSRRGKKNPDEPERVYERPPVTWLEKTLAVVLPLLLIGALITALILATRRLHQQPASALLPGRPATTPSVGAVAHAVTQAPTGGSTGVQIGLVVGLLTVVAAFAIVLLARLRRRGSVRETSAHDRAPHAALAKAVGLSIDDLRGERDPRRAIVAAYARMERAFAGLGLPRPPNETSTEYMGRVLSRASAPSRALLELTELFQEAKFSRHRLTSDDRDDALRALAEIREAMIQ